MTVEVRWRWALPLISGLILLMLRHHPWLSLIYCASLVIMIVAYLVWRKRNAETTAKAFRQQLMLHLADSNQEGLALLIKPSKRMSLLGLDGLLHEGRSFHCALEEQYVAAGDWARRALAHAKVEDRNRLLFNLARWTALSGDLGAAEKLYRRLMAANPRFMGARTHLGVCLARREETLDEALKLFAEAEAEGGLGRDLSLLLQVSEAQLRGRDPRWELTLARCEALGASATQLAPIRALVGASSGSEGPDEG